MSQGCRTHQKKFTKLQKNTLLSRAVVGILFLLTLWVFVSPAANATKMVTHPIFVTVQPGDTLYSIFRKEKISPKTLSNILHSPVAAQLTTNLHAGQHIRFLLDQKNALESLALSLKGSKTLVVFRGGGSRFIARVEKGSFRVPARTLSQPISAPPKPHISVKPAPSRLKPSIKAPSSPPTPSKTTPKPSKINIEKKASVVSPKPQAKPQTKPQTKSLPKKPVPKKSPFPPLHYAGMIIHSSLYTDGQRYQIPSKILRQLTQIFALQINFKDIHPGDKLVLAYDDAYSQGHKIGPGNIIAAKFTQGHRIYSAVRYVDARGRVEYFSPNGESMKKAFNRFPVKYTHINSLFNMHRMHPVTHVVRPHTGIDLAAPIGTPIYSIGDGQISFIGWRGAYGNIIKIQHNDKYSSMYAHMLRFAPGLSIRSYVKKGQLIGFLGQTGNATGPHVHFEIRVYDIPVNPLTVSLPNSSSVPSSQLAAFRAKSKNLMAALDYYQRTHLKA